MFRILLLFSLLFCCVSVWPCVCVWSVHVSTWFHWALIVMSSLLFWLWTPYLSLSYLLQVEQAQKETNIIQNKVLHISDYTLKIEEISWQRFNEIHNLFSIDNKSVYKSWRRYFEDIFCYKILLSNHTISNNLILSATFKAIDSSLSTLSISVNFFPIM